MFKDQFEQFFILLCRLLLIAAANCGGGAVLEMIAHEGPAHAAQRFLNGGDLDDDIGTIALFFDHFLETANLSLNATKTLQVGAFDIRIDGYSLARAIFYCASA